MPCCRPSAAEPRQGRFSALKLELTPDQHPGFLRHQAGVVDTQNACCPPATRSLPAITALGISACAHALAVGRGSTQPPSPQLAGSTTANHTTWAASGGRSVTEGCPPAGYPPVTLRSPAVAAVVARAHLFGGCPCSPDQQVARLPACLQDPAEACLAPRPSSEGHPSQCCSQSSSPPQK